MPEDRKNMEWNWTLTIGSTLVPFMFGLLFYKYGFSKACQLMQREICLRTSGLRQSLLCSWRDCLNFALLLTWIELYCTKKLRSDP